MQVTSIGFISLDALANVLMKVLVIVIPGLLNMHVECETRLKVA